MLIGFEEFKQILQYKIIKKIINPVFVLNEYEINPFQSLIKLYKLQKWKFCILLKVKQSFDLRSLKFEGIKDIKLEIRAKKSINLSELKFQEYLYDKVTLISINIAENI